MPAVKIAPSVLASDLGNLTHEAQRMLACGADWLHIDIMDGHFVPNIVMGAPILKCVHEQLPDAFMDCHMMVTHPQHVRVAITRLICSGSKILRLQVAPHTHSIWKRKVRVSSKLTLGDPLETVRIIKASNMRASLAINPGTPADAIPKELADAVDMILIMTVWPGAGGQKFIKECMPKVAQLRAHYPDLDVEVDGGVGPKTIDACAHAGANVIVAGTAVFKDPNPESVITFLRERCEESQARIRGERERFLKGEKIDFQNSDPACNFTSYLE